MDYGICFMDILHSSFSADQLELHFELLQTVDLAEHATRSPRQVQFLQLNKSKDLLLCVSNATPTQSLRIYQHQGITGFQQIIGESTLPVAKYLHILQLPVAQRQLLVLASEQDGIFLVAPQFTVF